MLGRVPCLAADGLARELDRLGALRLGDEEQGAVTGAVADVPGGLLGPGGGRAGRDATEEGGARSPRRRGCG
uniref:Uncharacterized protein n=1 Tax=Janibacter limosus TaxID=53458 RepID=A0AC61U1G7_9MICO|nr:hypothetical protein [Janibacter limosus]